MWMTSVGSSSRGVVTGREPAAAAFAALIAAGLLAPVACSSSTADKDPSVDVGALCATRDPGPAPMRRLTRVEYARTVRDLIGPGLVDAAGLPPDERVLGFDNNADVLGTSDLLIEQYQDLAERVGAVVAADLPRFVPCAAAGGAVGGDAAVACARTFVGDFGRRAWRRPLEAAELDALTAVFIAGEAQGGVEGAFVEGVTRTVAVLLQSPQFLYRVELLADETGAATGTPVAGLAGAVQLSPHETAARLSYLIWGSMPDAALEAAADAGELSTPAALAREARRLLADPRSREVVSSFHASWLGLDRLDDLDKDLVVYPTFNAALRDSFRAETTRFIDEVIWKREGTLAALLGARYTFVDGPLSRFYGVSAAVGGGAAGVGDELRYAALPAGRAGLLTQPSFLAVHAKANQTSPIHRGRFVREQMFCMTPPPPPSNVEIRPPVLDPRKTTRERFSQHTSEAACAGCHRLMDPIGFGFEHYDGLGRWRDQEGGIPVDASGSLAATDVDGDFNGAVELADRLARSADVARCYATQWFRFGYGRGESVADDCSRAQLTAAFKAAKGNVRELLVALTQTDAFRYRRSGDSP